MTALCCKLEIKLGYSGGLVEFLKTKLLLTGQSQRWTEAGWSCCRLPDSADYPVTAGRISRTEREMKGDEEDGKWLQEEDVMGGSVMAHIATTTTTTATTF